MAQTRIADVGRLARFPSSRLTKWFVLGFWLLVLAAAFGPAGKLQGVLNNEAVAWLPADAQSTQVVKQSRGVPEQERVPGRHRLRAALRSHPRGPPGGHGAGGQVQRARARPQGQRRPHPVAGRQGAAGDRPRRRGQRRVGLAGRDRQGSADHRQGPSGRVVDAGHGSGGARGRLVCGVLGDRRQAALLGHDGRDHHPAADLPQPRSLAHPGGLRGHGALRRAGRHLLPRQGRHPHRQRAELGDPHGHRVRRRHRLRPAARRPVPRGAAPARGPARGDGVRPPPRRPGHLRLRCDRHRRHALPARRDA